MIKERKKEMQNLMKKTRGQKMKNIMNHQKDSNSSMKSFFRRFKRSTEKVKIIQRKYTLD
jgi:anion-transporting  ArsA/GET3 family ATPase